MALFVFTSCTNDESVFEETQNTEESESITTTLFQLKSQFNDDGNVTETDNPAGNIVLDFCFDFVYPLELSYNNGTTVTVADLDGLIDIMFSSNENLYIDGIAFPFNVETYNENSNAIEIVTINNEEAFILLLESCEFDVVEPCICTEEYNPVCVEITDPNGGTFTVTYPNACSAECDGFTENDFAENCEDDYNPSGNECFTLNFPLSIITDDGTTLVINSEEEFGNTLYNVYNFDFVYPFTVTLENEDVATINSPEDIEAILTDCFGDIGGNECIECADAVFDPVCIEYVDAAGETIITVFSNMCYAECEGFTLNNVIDCEDDTNPVVCSEDDVSNFLVQCEWFATSSLNPNNNPGIFTFNADGTVSVFIEGNTITGTWGLASNTPTGEVFMFLVLPAPYEGISNTDWAVVSCNEGFIALGFNDEFLGFERVCD